MRGPIETISVNRTAKEIMKKTIRPVILKWRQTEPVLILCIVVAVDISVRVMIRLFLGDFAPLL